MFVYAEIHHESMCEFWTFLTCPQSKQLKLHAWESEIIISILKITSAISRNAGLSVNQEAVDMFICFGLQKSDSQRFMSLKVETLGGKLVGKI